MMIKALFKFSIFILFISNCLPGYSQETFIYGFVLNENRVPFDPGVNIAVVGTPAGTVTNPDGSYKLSIQPDTVLRIRYSFTGYAPVERNISLSEGDHKRIDITISQSLALDTFEIMARRGFDGIIRIDKKKLELMPTASGDYITEFLKRIPGVNSNNELSSQYSVRGGNYDENLVYVNGIEVYRPVLIRSGQQEGLPFINSDLIDNILFYAGGFNASYGDKMSSVLDITYNKPKEFSGAFRGSLMGGAVFIEDAAKNIPLRYLFGARYKTNSYLLSSLDTKGDYRPSFADLQTYISYDLNEYWELSFLGNISRNKFHMVPADRETNFGTVYEALRFTVFFEGQEVDQFNTAMGSFKISRNKNKLNSWIAVSLHRMVEQESFDILGQYRLDVLENDLGEDDFGQVAFNKGIGSFLNHGRNELDGWIGNLKYEAEFDDKIKWGVELRHDLLNDRLSEWQLIDSAGYSLPHPADNIGNTIIGYVRPNTIEFFDVVKAKNYNIHISRVSGFFQRKWTTKIKQSEMIIEAGARLTYWDYADEFLFSPRAVAYLAPNRFKNLSLRISTGIYSQPGFYREMRYFDGSLVDGVKSQKSWQIIAGGDYNFVAWDRDFKLTVESYYKYFWDLIPYEIEDVRIRYFANNNAIGYATGVDVKLNGEFVEDAESWVGISFLKTQEDILDDYYYAFYNAAGEKIIPGITYDVTVVDSQRVEPGFIPRPTDQRVTFNLFFQDYIPGYPTYKVHLNLVFGTGLPFGPPTHNRYQQTRRYPPYRRVDIGFSKQLIGDDTKMRERNPLRKLESLWISVEVFNLLQISNTLSYIWISDVEGRLNSIPNYLTPRRLNIQLSAKF